MKILTKEWLNFAKDDLDVAARILDDEHLTNMVAFHSHQAVEKCFKAVAEEMEIKIKKSHNLVTIAAEIKDFIKLKDEGNILRKLNEIYISSRYPIDLGLMPSGKPNMDEAKIFYEFAENLYHQVYVVLDKIKN